MKLWLKQGPYKIVEDKECLCQNNSKGVKCASCVSGFFNLDDSCTRLVQGRKIPGLPVSFLLLLLGITVMLIHFACYPSSVKTS